MAKFEYVGLNDFVTIDGDVLERPANCYAGNKCLNGETLELEGFFADKAMSNSDYRLIKPRKPKAKEEAEEEPEAAEIEPEVIEEEPEVVAVSD